MNECTEPEPETFATEPAAVSLTLTSTAPDATFHEPPQEPAHA